MKTLYVVMIAVALAFSSGCWPKKRRPVVVAPPAPPPAAQQSPTPEPAPKETVPASPAPPPTPTPATETPSAATPPKPRAPRPRGQPAAPPQPAPTEQPAATSPAAPTAPVPQLGAMIPAAQRKQLDAAYEADLNKARAVLAAVGTANLDAPRTEMATRVRSFVRQAEEFRLRDLAAAAELAQRARVLAEDLERRSK